MRVGWPRPEAERTVSELAAEGLVCDARFAEAFVRVRVERGSGPLRIRRDLEARGVAAEAFEGFLARDGEEEWIARARRAREKRFGALPRARADVDVDAGDEGAGGEGREGRSGGGGAAAETRRQARFLAGRGFTRRQVREALRERGESELP